MLCARFQKFSSNVLDYIIKNDEKIAQKLIDNIISQNLVATLILDQFGNYVIQNALNISKDDKLHSLLLQIKDVFEELKQKNYGKKVCENLIKNFPDFFIVKNIC